MIVFFREEIVLNICDIYIKNDVRPIYALLSKVILVFHRYDIFVLFFCFFVFVFVFYYYYYYYYYFFFFFFLHNLILWLWVGEV